MNAKFPLGEIPRGGSAPAILTASSQQVDWVPIFGRQWNLTKLASSLSFSRRKVLTPKPSIIRNERGMARSDIAHMIMWVLSGVRPMKSQNVSCALAA